jgi:hypothetical protein
MHWAHVLGDLSVDRPVLVQHDDVLDEMTIQAAGFTAVAGVFARS